MRARRAVRLGRRADVAALAELCGDAWTPDHETSWATVYGVLADLAIAGAKRARAQG